MAYHIEYTWHAEAALESLPSPEREEVRSSIERLRQGPNPPGVPQVYRLRGPEGLHVMHAGRDQRLRVVFTVGPGEVISIQDIVSRNLIRAFRGSVSE